MFELMRPQKNLVGKRLRMVKEELDVSFTELGSRLGLAKPTINSYVQGYTLAPLEVIEQLAKITGKSEGWFYFGEMEEYIRDYLVKKGHEVLLFDFPDIPVRLKEDFLDNEDSGWNWKNEYGYPCEESMDDSFAEVYDEIMKEYIFSLTKEYMAEHCPLETKKQLEVVTLIANEVYECFDELHDFNYGDKSKIEKHIELFYARDVKDKYITYDDEYLIGRLITLLDDDTQTVDFIDNLSIHLTGKGRLNTTSNVDNLIKIFQALRPELIKLYTQHSKNEFQEWFEK